MIVTKQCIALAFCQPQPKPQSSEVTIAQVVQACVLRVILPGMFNFNHHVEPFPGPGLSMRTIHASHMRTSSAAGASIPCTGYPFTGYAGQVKDPLIQH